LDIQDFEDAEIEDVDVDEDEEYEDWDEIDNLTELTNVDKQNPIQYLKQGFNYVQSNNPDYYNTLLGLIGTEGMRLLDSKIKESEKLN